MSLAASGGIVRTANLGGVSAPPSRRRAFADESSRNTTTTSMCYKRPGYTDGSDESQHSGEPVMGGSQYTGEREAKLRRVTPGLDEAGGAAAAAAAASAQQATARHYGNQQQQEPMDITDNGGGVGAGVADNQRLKRNKPVKWSAEEDRRLRDAVVRVSTAVLRICACREFRALILWCV